CLAQQFGRRGLIFGCVVVTLGAWGAYTASSAIQGRVAQTIEQLKNQFGTPRQHSREPRLEYYEHTFGLIKRHPFFGTGTGSFRKEYAKITADYARTTKSDSIAPTDDPHNEYLHLASQAGLPTAGLFVALLVLQWRT